MKFKVFRDKKSNHCFLIEEFLLDWEQDQFISDESILTHKIFKVSKDTKVITIFL